MRLWAIAASSTLLLAACGPKSAPSKPVPDLRPRLEAADALARIGCFDCLTAALGEYEAIGALPSAPATIVDAAASGAVQTMLLLDLRERELGLVDDGYLQRARARLSGRADLTGAFSTAFDFVDTVSWRIPEAQQTPEELGLERARRLGANRDAWKQAFRTAAGDSPFRAYLWLAFGCASGEALKMPAEELAAPFAPLRDAPILVYKRATCPLIDARALTTLVEREPRYVEANYFLGLQSLLRGNLDGADQYLQRAYEWRRAWPAVTLNLANVAMTAEELDRALAFYDETLRLAPGQRDAMLGRVKALTYQSRHEDAIEAADKMLEGRWNRGDAYYWRAWNEMELGRNDQAWADVEDAWKLSISSDVAKLAGMIAYRRQQLDVARAKFETGYKMNANDCECGYFLGIVHAEQRNWTPAVDVFTSTGSCLEQARQRLTEEIARIQASGAASERRARQIAKREQQIRTMGRMLATSWFDTAVAYFNLSRKAEAREYAEKVTDDEQFGPRAKELLARISR